MRVQKYVTPTVLQVKIPTLHISILHMRINNGFFSVCFKDLTI